MSNPIVAARRDSQLLADAGTDGLAIESDTGAPTIWGNRFRTTSAVLAALIIVLGLVVLVGWTFHVDLIKRGLPSLAATMKANTAFLFVVLGTGLLLLRSQNPRAARAHRIIGLFVATASAVTFAQYVFAIDFGIDQLLVSDPRNLHYPGRMAPATALTFLLLGFALILHDGKRRSALSRAAGSLAAVIALIGVFGYLYGARSLFAIGPHTSVAVHTAIGLLLASSAFLMAHPDEGITGLLAGDSEAGHLLRRLVPAIILTTVIIGLVQVLGEVAGYYDLRTGVALASLVTLVALTLFSAIIAASLRRSELRRREIETARQRLLDEMQIAKASLEADVRALASLNRVASLFFPQHAPLQPVLTEVVAAAIAISDADFGNIQILDPTTSDLHIVAHQGFPDWWLEFWERVSHGQGACGTALEHRNRVVVEDVEESPVFVNTPALEIQRRAGVRAVQSTPLFTRSGEPIGMFSTHYAKPHRPSEQTLRLLDLLARLTADIIERAHADQQLRESEQRFRALVDASAQIVWATDATGAVTEDSPSWRRFTGQTYAHMRGAGWLDAIHPDDRAEVASAWRAAVQAGTDFETEYRLSHHSGQWRWTSVRAVPLRDPTGSVSGWIAMNIDITVKRNAQVGRERQLREIVENSPHAIAMLDTDMRYVEVSPRWLKDFGVDADLIGKSHYDVFPELPAELKEVHRRCLAGATEQCDEEPFVRQDGKVQWLRWKVCPWRDLEGAIAGILIYSEDITALRSALESARAAREQLQLGQRVARIGTFDWNIQTGLNTWTPELEQMYGLPVGGFARSQPAWENLVHPDDRASAVQSVERALATGVPTESEWRVRWPDGSTHWLTGRFQAFKDDTGKPLHLIGINIEITERKLIEEQRERLLDEVRDLTKNLEARVAQRTREVELARDRLEGIISMAADAIISINQDQRITIFNRSAEEIFGWTRAEVLGKPLDLLLPESLRAAHHDHRALFTDDAINSRRMAERTEVFGRRKNGVAFPAEATISTQKTDEGCQFTVILRDITERKRLEEERARTYAERAVLLKEIHHRVKNNLQVISSLFYLQERRTEVEAVRKVLSESRTRLHSIALIHDKLYRSEQLASIDFGDYLRDLTASLTSAIGVPRVRVRVEADPVFLDIDRAIPCALIVNELVSNSLKHAFPADRHGEVRITVRQLDTDLLVDVSDNGIGFPADLDFNRVSTLGLQLVVTLAKQLLGRVELRRGEGTTFRLQFPAYPTGTRAGAAAHPHPS